MATIVQLINAKELHPKREQRSLSWSEDANEGFRSVFVKREIIEMLILNLWWLKHIVTSLVQDTRSARSFRSSLSTSIFFNTEYLLPWLGLQHLHSHLSPCLIDH